MPEGKQQVDEKARQNARQLAELLGALVDADDDVKRVVVDLLARSRRT